MIKKIFCFLVLIQAIIPNIYAQTDTVIMYDNDFKPATLTIRPGQKVVWFNKSKMDHTSTSGTNCSKDGKWNSGYISEGQTYTYTFNTEGTYNYYCIPHCISGMKGVIIVKGNPTSSEENSEVKKKVNEEGYETKKSKPDFKGTDIINAVTIKTLDKGVLDFSIYHRFDDLTGAKGGPQVLYGLDNMRDMRLALSYGIIKNVTVGIGRSKGDWFNAPYQEVKNLYDGNIKIRICSQDSGRKKIPFSVSVYANTVYTAMKSHDMIGSEANFKYFSDRFSHSCQIIVARNFSKYLSVQIMPVYLRRNWVFTCPEMSMDELDLFSLGGGFRWGFSDTFAIIAEYFYVFSNYRHSNKDVFSDPLAIGFEINTGGHIFHINLSNATGIIPNTFIPYTTSSWLNKGFRLGFSISRKFVLIKNSGASKKSRKNEKVKN